MQKRIEEASAALQALGLPKEQQNERSALTLLALLDLTPNNQWSEAAAPLIGVTPIMEFCQRYYGADYKPNTRESFRKATLHQFCDAGITVINPDDPGRATNSGKTVYQIESSALALLQSFGSKQWEDDLTAYLASITTLRDRYAQERAMARIPVTVADGKVITLSPGGQNVLIEQIIHEFAPRFTPGGKILYIGDTGEKFVFFDADTLAELGIVTEAHGKMPDLIIYYTAKKWLVLIEAVTSHGPIDAKRRAELQALFQSSQAGLVFITAFLTRKAMAPYLGRLAWETDIWVAEAPSHLIHFNGDKFLGPASHD
ncbi:MAG: BsuBI/PstI family type II restriction endonuclease [Janthinobacterium lividum]